MSVLQTLEREAGSTRENVSSHYAKRIVWKRVFFKALAQTGNVTESARLASVHPVYVRTLKGKDARFARRWQRAMLQATMTLKDDLESAVRERATTGKRRMVLDKDGDVVEVQDKPSDKAAELLLKAKFPRQYDRRATSHGNTTTIVCPQSMQIAFLTQPDVREATLAFESALAAANGPPRPSMPIEDQSSPSSSRT